jgi:hypothetical protein
MLLKRARALGMPVEDDFSRERIIFIAAQTIISLIDEIIGKEGRNDRLITITEDERQPIIEEKSTLASTEKGKLGNLNIAALIY